MCIGAQETPVSRLILESVLVYRRHASTVRCPMAGVPKILVLIFHRLLEVLRQQKVLPHWASDHLFSNRTDSCEIKSMKTPQRRRGINPRNCYLCCGRRCFVFLDGIRCGDCSCHWISIIYLNQQRANARNV